jgi:hypothetical protein
MNVGIGTVAAQFLSGNICFEFSLLCLCSVLHVVTGFKHSDRDYTRLLQNKIVGLRIHYSE